MRGVGLEDGRKVSSDTLLEAEKVDGVAPVLDDQESLSDGDGEDVELVVNDSDTGRTVHTPQSDGGVLAAGHHQTLGHHHVCHLRRTKKIKRI